MPSASACPFCREPATPVIGGNEHAFAILDAHPVAPGHALVISRRHTASLFELGETERAALWALVGDVRTWLATEFNPAGFNIGLNDGPAAGQTVPHVHIHVIPRRAGDCADPRGGVRWVLPEKARYWD